MNFLASFHTDVGIRKKTNQDSLLLQEAETENGNALLAVICDGMGGLALGEVASAAVINAFSKWFTEKFPLLLQEGFTPEKIKAQWENLLFNMNSKIHQFGDLQHVNLGTTTAALLLYNNTYCVINIGDSWVCKVTDSLEKITKDQTYVQREIDAGRMTPEQAEHDPQRNVLLQCVGIGGFIEPDFYTATTTPGTVYLLCSDGFRHKIQPKEFYEKLNPYVLNDENNIRETLVYLTELNKYRREDDNISSIVIRTM